MFTCAEAQAIGKQEQLSLRVLQGANERYTYVADSDISGFVGRLLPMAGGGGVRWPGGMGWLYIFERIQLSTAIAAQRVIRIVGLTESNACTQLHATPTTQGSRTSNKLPTTASSNGHILCEAAVSEHCHSTLVSLIVECHTQHALGRLLLPSASVNVLAGCCRGHVIETTAFNCKGA